MTLRQIEAWDRLYERGEISQDEWFARFRDEGVSLGRYAWLKSLGTGFVLLQCLMWGLAAVVGAYWFDVWAWGW